MAGENHRCENPARFLVPGELGQYLYGATICKSHLQYLLKNPDWAEQFIKVLKEHGVAKGQNILELQDLQRKQAIWSEMS